MPWNNEDITARTEGEGTAFNGALATLQRIDKALSLASESFIRGDVNGYLRGVIVACRELEPFIDDDEELKILDHKEKIASGSVQMYIDTSKHQRPPAPFMMVRVFEQAVRRNLHKQGLLMPKADDPRMAAID